MNIKEAKNSIKDAIRFYLMKKEDGTYKIPVNRQRPLAMIGPAGVGKTDVARQAAEEMGINFLSYTITHHTRQIIMGLPRLSVREYEGQEYHVTDYTMSEIIAEIHEMIKNTGRKEGVLFLDELPEFKKDTLDLMRQPLEDGQVTISRVSGTVTVQGPKSWFRRWMVWGQATPSGLRFWSIWNCMTAFSMPPPKMPSTPLGLR